MTKPDCKENECVWTPDRWEDFGAMKATLDRVERKLDLLGVSHADLTRRVDILNHVRRRGAQWGAAGGSIATMIIAGLYAFLKTKISWLP